MTETVQPRRGLKEQATPVSCEETGQGGQGSLGPVARLTWQFEGRTTVFLAILVHREWRFLGDNSVAHLTEVLKVLQHGVQGKLGYGPSNSYFFNKT